MSPHLALVQSHASSAVQLDLLPHDFESQEVTEIEAFSSYEVEVTDPIIAPTDAYEEAQNRSPSSTLSFLFRIL